MFFYIVIANVRGNDTDDVCVIDFIDNIIRVCKEHTQLLFGSQSVFRFFILFFNRLRKKYSLLCIRMYKACKRYSLSGIRIPVQKGLMAARSGEEA